MADERVIVDLKAALGAHLRTMLVVSELPGERDRQRAKHGDQVHLPDGTGPEKHIGGLPVLNDGALLEDLSTFFRTRTDLHARTGEMTWLDILLEEVFEAAEADGHAHLREELVQVAAVAVAWIEALDARGRFAVDGDGEVAVVV